jgi:Pyruvate-formate lyase
MEQNRLTLLLKYKKEREKTLDEESGEATGRIYRKDTESLVRKMRAGLNVEENVLQAFKIVTENSPVEVRPGEIIVGDYYYIIPYTFIPFIPSPGTDFKNAAIPCGHTTPNFEKAFKLGWDGIEAEIKLSLDRWKREEALKKVVYLEALLRLVELIQKRIEAYAQKAEDLANTCDEPAQAFEYSEIAAICRKLMHKPPETLREAVQWFWFYITAVRVTSTGMGACRLDQVFYPFYINDIKVGRITEEDALSLIQALFIKEGLFYCIGGVDENGNDAVNRLSYLALMAYDSIGGPSNLNVRWHKDIDPAFFDIATDILLRHKTGVPNIVNDEIIIPSLLHFGFTLQQARVYAFSGCFWYVVPGKEYPYHDNEGISGTHVLLKAIDEAVKIKPEQFDDFYRLYIKALKNEVDMLQTGLEAVDAQMPYIYKEMVLSLAMDGCIEKGLDVTENGAEKSMITVNFIGLATVANSLTAIKKLIYDDKALDWEQLYTALGCNFAGMPELLFKIEKISKFGNDNGEADEMAVAVAESYKHELCGRINSKGFCFRPAFYSWNGHIMIGLGLGATPDGRQAGKPVSQGVNPSNGTAKSGLTADINSIAKISYKDTAGAPVHIHMPDVGSGLTADVVKKIILTSFEKGIIQIILNFADIEAMKKAIDDPDSYWDLVIRVTGYSARFVQLGRKIQEEFITRNIF